VHIDRAGRLFIRAGSVDGFIVAIAGEKDLHRIAAMQTDGILFDCPSRDISSRRNARGLDPQRSRFFIK
jgi:hypothetical protein